MNNIKYFAIEFLSIGILFFSCKKATQQTAQNINVGLNNCSSISTNTNANFSICYDSLLKDSRCYEPALCIWKGEVAVQLSFKQNNSVIPFKLSDSPNINNNPPNDTTINSVHIKLIDVLPHPFSNQNSDKKVLLEVN
jgi:hypothetical protein